MIETFPDRDKILARYLLNELSESEMIELEDEMLLDDELAERLQVVEMNLIDAYVRDEMTSEERLRFQEGFLALTENRDKVNQAQTFHKSLRLLHEKVQVPPIAAQERSPRQWFLGLFQRPLPALAFTAATLLLITTVFVALSIRNRQENGKIVVTNPTPPASGNANQGSNNTADNPVTGAAPTPQQQQQPSVAPSVNNRPNGSGLELARNDSYRYTQRAQLNPTKGSGERGGGGVVHITLGKKVTNLELSYELMEGVDRREVYGVTIKDEYNVPIWPQNGKGKEEVRAVTKTVKKGEPPKEFIIVKVPVSIFKDKGPYMFEFDGPYIRPARFTIKKIQ